MSSNNDDNSKGQGDGEGPRTSWVRMPTRDPRPPTTPEPAPTWTPPVGRAPASEAPRAADRAAPFGGFQAGQTTGMVRRSSDRGRLIAVIAVIAVVLGLSVAAVLLALRPKPTPEKPVTTELKESKPLEPTPDPAEDDAEAEALGYTKTDGKPTEKASTGKSGSGKSGSSKSGSGKTTTEKPAGRPGLTRPDGR